MVKSYIFLLITVIIYAGNLLVGKGVSDLSPVIVTFYRLFIALLILIPFGWKERYKIKELVKKEWKPLLSMSLSGIIFFNLLIYLSLHFTSTTNAGIVESTTPVFTFILGYIFLKERFNLIQIFGMVISLFGAIWVISGGSLTVIRNMEINIGDLFMLIAVILWSIYTILVKRHNHSYPVYGSLIIMLSIGVVALLPFALFNFVAFIQVFISFDIVLSLMYLGIFPSIIALIFWNKAVEEIGASKASIFLNLLPVFTTAGAVIFFQEKIIAAQIVGGIIVISGVMMTSITRTKVIRERPVLEEKKDVTI